jgi:hypothetical protein
VHRIDDLNAKALTYGGLPPWVNIASNFRDACWYYDGCYVVLRFRPAWKCVVFFAGIIEAKSSSIPRNLACSDCPPSPLVESMVSRLVGRSLLDYGRLYSVASASGVRGRQLYHIDKGASMGRSDTTGGETVVAYPRSRFRNFDIVALRVSPNERYLAYGLFTELRAPIPLPDQAVQLHVYDLLEKKDHKISSGYRYISNVSWSPDSRRFYFAGIQGKNRAVYRVDVEKALAD